jgi:molybdate transport system substrate-binding protein
LTISTGSSAALRTQIEEGAPADVFLSADTSNPQALADSDRLAGDPVSFASNALTIVVPTGNPGAVESPHDLGREGVAVVAAGDEVPIQRYARQVVENLAATAGYPPDFAHLYDANVVSREENVGAVMAKIELGEGDAAIVYVTDAAGSDAVESIQIPAEANVVADYAGAVIQASSQQPEAQAFLEWLAGAEGQAILSGYGFSPPR